MRQQPKENEQHEQRDVADHINKGMPWVITYSWHSASTEGYLVSLYSLMFKSIESLTTYYYVVKHVFATYCFSHLFKKKIF